MSPKTKNKKSPAKAKGKPHSSSSSGGKKRTAPKPKAAIAIGGKPGLKSHRLAAQQRPAKQVVERVLEEEEIKQKTPPVYKDDQYGPYIPYSKKTPASAPQKSVPQAGKSSGPTPRGPKAFLERLSQGGASRPTPSRRESDFDHSKPSNTGGSAAPRSERPKFSQNLYDELKSSKRKDRRKFDRRSADREPYRPATGSDIAPKPKRRPDEIIAPTEKSRMDLVEGEIQKNKKGFAFLLREKDDLFIPPEYASELLSGDRVKAWFNPRSKEVHRIEVVSRGIKSFIGTYQKEGGRHVVHLRDRTMDEPVLVRAPDLNIPEQATIVPGHKVMCMIEEYEPQLKGSMIKDFGAELAPKFDTLAVVVKAQWPQEFSVQAQAQATEASRTIIQNAASKLGAAGGRKDLRDKPLVTIDGADARDFDDAVYVEKTKAGYVLYVAIADVAEFIEPGSALDQEAYARATSVYFPDYVLPMLPEALSNGACSLKPNEERLTLACEMHYDLSGKRRSARIYEAIIKSERRCIYEDVQKEYEAGDERWTVTYELFRLIRESRIARGAIDLDLPEAKVVLDEKGDTAAIRKAVRLDVHRVIEEFMIAANEAVTEHMEREGWPFVFRVHEPPKPESLQRFLTFAYAIGMKPDIGDGMHPKKIAQFLKSLEGHALSSVLSYLILRSLKQARYSSENMKHFGLASKAYTHFTSPIRRYPDLIVHRILKAYLRRESLPGGEHEFRGYLTEATDHCSRQERKSTDLERTVQKVKKARFMLNHLGEEYTAKITNVSESGLFIELQEWFVEGLVPSDEIGEDYYEFNEEKLLLYGRRSGRKIRIGDEIQVMVLRCDTEQGLIDFTMRFKGAEE